MITRADIVSRPIPGAVLFMQPIRDRIQFAYYCKSDTQDTGGHRIEDTRRRRRGLVGRKS